jgi:hypothetical protein
LESFYRPQATWRDPTGAYHRRPLTVSPQMNVLEQMKSIVSIDYGELLPGILIGTIVCVLLILIVRIVRGRTTQ